MRISDWSSDVCSSDLLGNPVRGRYRLAAQLFPTAGLEIRFNLPLAGRLPSAVEDHLLQGFDEGCNRTAPEGQRETVPRFGQRRIVCDHRYLPMGERLGHRQAPSLIVAGIDGERARPVRSEEHTSELQS